VKTFKQHLNERIDIVSGKKLSDMTPGEKREYRNRRRRDNYHQFKSKYNPWASSSAIGRDKSRT